MKQLNDFENVYFIGAGGIGMSAIARYFLALGKEVAGYDRTATPLTSHLEEEGAHLHFEDDVDLIPCNMQDASRTLVVYTPAIPKDHSEWRYFRDHEFTIMKRAQVLGLITRSSRGLCVAGTHGKTSTSTMTAHLLYQSSVGCTAFLGGVSQNYSSNLLLDTNSPYTVIEADEFDRSFHQLSPWMSVITSDDPDHLDIYGDEAHYKEAFSQYTQLIRPGGALIMHEGLTITPQVQEGVHIYTYGRTSGDFHAANERIGHGTIIIDFVGPDITIKDVELGVPVTINIDNGVAAMALAYMNGVSPNEIQTGMKSFRGIERRFDFRLKTEAITLLSDYAHHPSEIKQSIASVRALYPEKKITVIFQPHLYSRTQDFYPGFATSLSAADEVILLPIYPARELPIPGVSSQLILERIHPSIPCELSTKKNLLETLKKRDLDVVITLGAGDIEDECDSIQKMLEARYL